MRILISNDDGILAPGISALRAAASDLGDVTVVAPDSPQSAAGHAITIYSPLRARRVVVEGPGGPFEGFSVDGRPADCVRLAIRNLLDEPPDLVLSGINAGANVGINVFYSGTVAAAAEAAMFGIPAVAFSASMVGEVNFAAAAKHCRRVLESLLAGGLTGGDLVNVNIPELTGQAPLGVVVVPQSTAGIDDEYEAIVHEADRLDPEGQSYRLGKKYEHLPGEPDSDVVRLTEGYITVTPLHVDMTNHDRLHSLGGYPWPG